MELRLGLGLPPGRGTRPTGGSIPPTDPPGGGGGGGSGGFEGHEIPPTVEVVEDTVVIHGKTKQGFVGRIVVPLGALVAGRTYNVNIVADLTGLALDGAKAGIGFGFKSGNNFRLELLQGNAGSTRLATISGSPPTGWNKNTGHTVQAHGAPTNGTQHAMDIQMVVNGDGDAYTFSTSGDDQASWDEELADQPLTPFADITEIDSGAAIAAYFASDDFGSYIITVTWVEAEQQELYRYFRIHITDNNHATFNYTGLVEMQLHTGETGSGINGFVGGTASASNEFDVNHAASNGFDDQLLDAAGNIWGTEDVPFPHWLKYDLGSGNQSSFSGLSIVGRDLNAGIVDFTPRDFTVQGSNDDNTWDVLLTRTGVTWNLFEFKLFTDVNYTGSPHGAHAYWRLRCLADDGGTVCSATEIEMRATPGGADQCTGGTPLSNGEVGGFVDDNAFDNNNTTFFASTTPSDATYIGYHFAAPVEVAQFTWRNRQDGNANQAPVKLAVQFSDNGTAWTTAWTQAGWTGWSLSQTRTSTDPYYV